LPSPYATSALRAASMPSFVIRDHHVMQIARAIESAVQFAHR
jgi:hypothetical protein